jgi:hypothetical protein
MIKKPIARVFARAAIKRRKVTDGLFETDWQDISGDVKSFGKITTAVDSARLFKFTFSTAKLTVENQSGRYNPSDSPSSLWYGYLNQQRTLVRIQAGFKHASKDANGVYTVSEFPSGAGWDEAIFDNDEDQWDDDGSPTMFVGILSGDIPLSDKNEVALNLRPLVSVFQDFPARNLTGWTSTGLTASQFVTMVRDQVDANGSYVFRPFFGDTTSNWDISTTSTVFSNLNTSTAADVLDKTVWEVIEKLAEAENFLPYITRDGAFKFISRATVDATPVFQFHGAGSFNSEYGQTIKAVANYGFKLSKYYSRVQLKYRDENTTTSYRVIESALEVSPTNNPWLLGVRTLQLENFYIPTSTVADTLAESIFDEVSALKKEIEFTTTFVPHLDLLDRVSIYYDPAESDSASLWDLNSWAYDSTATADDLIFDSSDGDAILLEGQEFKFLSIEIDLDNFSNRFLAREV